MTIRQLIKNISKPANLYYIIQSKIRQAIQPLPEEEILAKVANHPRCFFSGECQRCGCDFHDVLASDKRCKDVMEGDIIAIRTRSGYTVRTYRNTIIDTDFIVLNRVKDED